MSDLTAQAQNFNWLLADFVNGTHGVEHALGVSSDGLVIAISDGLDRETGDQFAAITSGLASLAAGAARCFDYSGVDQVIVEMHEGMLFVSKISDGSSLGVIASKDCDIGLVAYEMTVLVKKAGVVLTPELIAELKGAFLG